MLANVILLKYPESQDYGRDFRSVTCEKKKRKNCRDFCEFIRDVKSSGLTTVYLFAFAFSSFFNLWVLQPFPILIYHLFIVNTLRAFKSCLVKKISVFRLIVFPLWHNKGNNRTCSYQPIRWKRAQLLVCILIGSVGLRKRNDSEPDKRGFNETYVFFLL